MADRISVLPDEIICHILSFLPTKESVATSVLSKRWNPFWRSVPTLRFFENTSPFVRSVGAFLRSRNLHQPIKTFSLGCTSFRRGPNSVNKWISAALQCGGVEHLDVWFLYPTKLSSPFLTHRTLVVLKLTGVHITAFSSVDLPSLKILELSGVILEESGYLAKLLSGCPLLEDLVANSVSFDDSPSVAEFKSVPKLVKADISKLILFAAVTNVKFLQIHWRDVMDPGRNPSFKDLALVFPNLIHIKFYLCYAEDWPKIVEVLEHCPKLQTLVIDDYGFTEADEGGGGGGKWPYPQSVPESISLQLKTCRVNDYEGSNGLFQFARYILGNARFLQSMTIRTPSDTNPHAKLEMLKKLSLCPRCSATCKLSLE
ncbi:FBD-associated F-box protein At4g10400-like [Gastrolobium bilobum]|uniref:FBD-associated F-box protein At4g10400-like n=1 Tax=Gastrolobium bilobum TaxID=150636 RepID=UPI002AAFA831|nr:FBD-associated F-box protein At4g10400-like [Gastrolobium bilobum]